MRYLQVYYTLCILLTLLLFHNNVKAQSEYKAAVSLYDLFQMGGSDTPLGMNLKYVSAPGAITIEIYSDYVISDYKFPNVLLFKVIGHVTSSGSVTMESITYSNPLTQLGSIAGDYPHPWESIDLRSSALAAKNYYIRNEWSSMNPTTAYYDFLGSTVPVVIKTQNSGAELVSCQFPGIGEFYANGRVSQTLRMDQSNPNRESNSSISLAWVDLKTLPEDTEQVDIKYAAHRGFWGFDLGSGPAENTDPSIAAALPYTSIIESDITITRDNAVVVSHDYTLDRLTDYSGPDPENTFIYDLQFNDIKNLHLRRKNNDITEYTFIQLKDLLNFMKQYNTILTIDIKEKAKRNNPVTNQCTAACDMVGEKQIQAWVELFERVLDIVDQEDAWQYVAVKTPHTINTIKRLLPQNKYRQMSRIFYFPVIQPRIKQRDMLYFINDWHNNASDYLVGFETVFRTDESPCLQPFSIEGIYYTNALHYVSQRTRLRPGMYPEEPMGAKGVVDRYAQWRFKNLATDYRGDHFWLMSIPYFSQSILTTDRPDIWQQIVNIYGQK